jgi:hypothetical protein
VRLVPVGSRIIHCAAFGFYNIDSNNDILKKFGVILGKE